MIRTLLMVTAIYLSFSMTTYTHAQETQSLPPVPEAIQTLVERGAQIRYLGKKHGMDGWITIFQGQEQYYYVTPDRSGFVMGVLFDGDGKMATLGQVQELQKSGDAEILDFLTADQKPEQAAPQDISKTTDTLEFKTPAQRMFADVERSNWVALGSANAPAIYAFVDPQCPHCHEFTKDLHKDYIEQGKVQLRLVPVGFREETLAQAAFLLAAPDAQDRWFKHLAGDETALPVQNGISTQGVQKNLALMQAWKFNVTPLSVYKSKDGEIKIIRGRAKDIPSLLADLPS